MMVQFTMRRSLELKNKAIKLRHKGYSLKEISNKLNIAKSTASLWLRNVELDENAQIRLKKRDLLGYYRTSLRWQQKRAQQEKDFEKKALRELSKMKIDKLHAKIYCSLLFWCEGAKSDKTTVRFSNSDPKLISTFLVLFRKAFPVEENKFRALMHLHAYHSEARQKHYWSQISGIPKKQFQKTFQKPHTKKRLRKDYPGCISIVYYNADIAKELSAIYNAFQKRIGA